MDRGKAENLVAAGPVSRILSALASRTTIPLGLASLPGSSDLPGSLAHRVSTHRGCPRTPPLFGLAPCGVCHAARIATRPVRSYRTFSPLPLRAVSSLWHFPSNALNGALPDVIRHTTLRSSDFPPPHRHGPGEPGVNPCSSGRPAQRLTLALYETCKVVGYPDVTVGWYKVAGQLLPFRAIS